MQVAYREKEMTRNMDLIRQLLIGIESHPRLDRVNWIVPDANDNLGVIGVSDYSNEEIAYHLGLLIEADFVKGKVGNEEMPIISGLTWKGHEFLDNVRDSGVWSKTKERFKGLPNVAIGVIAAIAEAEVKKRLGLTP